MSSTNQGRTNASAAATVGGLSALGALLVGVAVGPPGIVIGALAGALVGYLAWC